jgi:hypothetical protein
MRTDIGRVARMTERSSERSHPTAWIMAIAALVTAIVGGGGIVGLLAAQSSHTSANSTGRDTPSSVGAPDATTPTTASQSTPQAAAPGTQLGHYNIDLSDGYMLLLSPDRHQPQPCCDGSYDLIYWSGNAFGVGNGKGDQVALYDGTANYQSCATDSRYTNNYLFINGKDLTGQTLCVSGRHLIAAAKITAMVHGSPAYVSLDLTIWQA